MSHLRLFGYVPYHHHGIHQWPLTENLGSMWGITVFPSIPQAPSYQGELFKASMLSEDIFQALWGDVKYQECQEINWNVQHISASNSRTQDIELHVQKIINLQHIANNLPNSFTGNNCAWKSGGTNKNHSTPCSKQEGEKYGHKQDSASCKQQRKMRKKPS